MQAYQNLLSSILSEATTDSLECTETLQKVTSISGNLIIWTLGEVSSLFVQYPIMNTLTTSILIPALGYVGRKGFLRYKDWKHVEEIREKVKTDLKQQKSALEDFIRYYRSVDTSIRSDLKIEVSYRWPDIFNLDVLEKCSVEDFEKTFHNESLVELKDIYSKLEHYCTLERVTNFREDYRRGLRSNSLTPPPINFSSINFQEEKDKIKRWQVQICSSVNGRIRDYKNLSEKIESFLEKV